MTYQRISHEWPLERYSRLVGDGNDEFKTYESSEDNFFLRILNSNYLVINHGNDVLENFSLVNAGITMKGVYIGDSLLVISKLLEGANADGKRTVPEMAKIIMGIDKSKLSKAYYEAIVPQEELEAILRLCLLDTSFPSYVESVEATIKKLVEESKSTT